MGVQDRPAGSGDVQEGQPAGKEPFDGDLVRGVQHGPGRPAAGRHLVTEIEGRERLPVRRLEVERRQGLPLLVTVMVIDRQIPR